MRRVTTSDEAKNNLLARLYELEAHGVILTKRYTMDDDWEAMRYEINYHTWNRMHSNWGPNLWDRLHRMEVRHHVATTLDTYHTNVSILAKWAINPFPIHCVVKDIRDNIIEDDSLYGVLVTSTGLFNFELSIPHLGGIFTFTCSDKSPHCYTATLEDGKYIVTELKQTNRTVPSLKRLAALHLSKTNREKEINIGELKELMSSLTLFKKPIT